MIQLAFYDQSGKKMPPAARVAKPHYAKNLESRLQMRFVLRSSGHITFALGFRLTQVFLKITCLATFLKGWPPAGPPEACF